MSARCLWCGAGNEWIEGKATLKKNPPISREDLETVCNAALNMADRADATALKRWGGPSMLVAAAVRAAVARVLEGMK